MVGRNLCCQAGFEFFDHTRRYPSASAATHERERDLLGSI